MKKNYLFFIVLLFVYFVQGQTISTIAGNGSSGFSGDGGAAIDARLNLPFNITFDASDNVYIADTYNNSIRKIDSETGIISTIFGTADKKEVSELKTPTGLTFDNFNNLYIADLANLRIREYNVKSGKSLTLAGEKNERDVPNIKTSLVGPFNLVFDHKGNLYVSTNGDSKVSKINFYTGEVTTIAGTGESGFSGDGGPAKDAKLSNPTGLALDNNDNLYISDSGNERIRKVDLNTGIISTVAGTGETGFSNEGNYALKTNLSNPLGLAVDKKGDLYIVDRGNNRVIKVNMETKIVSTIAGTGETGFSGDGGNAKDARLSNPTGLAFNNDGDLFIVDRGNNRIRKISGLSHYDESVVLENKILIYPNPSTDKVTVDLKEPSKLKEVSLFDLKGKNIQIQISDNSINVSKLPRGMYVLRVTTTEGTLEQKLVLE